MSWKQSRREEVGGQWGIGLVDVDVQVTVQVKAGGGDCWGWQCCEWGYQGESWSGMRGIGEPSGKCGLRQLIAVLNFFFVFVIFSLEPGIVYPPTLFFFLSQVQLI